MTEQTVTTTAVGTASARPDQVNVGFAANAVEPTVAAARRAVVEQAAGLREAVADAGVPDDRVRTEQFNIRRQRPGEPRHRGVDGDESDDYEATESVGVTVHDLDRLAGVLSGSVDAGVQIGDVTFTFRTGTRRALQREAVADAVETAREKASAAAAAEGLAVDEVRSIATDDGSQPRVTRSGGAPLSMDASGSVESGPIDVDVRVEVAYGLVEESGRGGLSVLDGSDGGRRSAATLVSPSTGGPRRLRTCRTASRRRTPSRRRARARRRASRPRPRRPAASAVPSGRPPCRR